MEAEHDPDDNLVDVDRIIGSTIYDMKGNRAGFVDRIILEKRAGRVYCAVIGLFSKSGASPDYQSVPWYILDYNERLGGFQLDIVGR